LCRPESICPNQGPEQITDALLFLTSIGFDCCSGYQERPLLSRPFFSFCLSCSCFVISLISPFLFHLAVSCACLNKWAAALTPAALVGVPAPMKPYQILFTWPAQQRDVKLP
jgi:hypothetical protein